MRIELDDEMMFMIGAHMRALDVAVEQLHPDKSEDEREKIIGQLINETYQWIDECSPETLGLMINKFSRLIMQKITSMKPHFDGLEIENENQPPQGLPYWRNETSGRLEAAVRDYLEGTEPMKFANQVALSTYLKIWVDYPWAVGEGEMRSQLETLRQSFDAMVTNGNRETISQWLEQALKIGIDPL